jgi:TPR repeat protein
MERQKYDIFISYRRNGGYDTAKHLYDLLTRDGYFVSFDIDTLRQGDFDKALYSRIDECSDFILLLDKHVFDRTLDFNFDKSKDWLRNELAYALKIGKNIIPIMLAGFYEFPNNLPEDISDVKFKNGPKYSMEYFDAFYQRLKEFFSTPVPKDKRGADDTIQLVKNFEYYQLKAFQGDTDAMCSIGISYVEGKDVEQSYNDAVYWFSKAASRGHAYARKNLGDCYYAGRGVKQDYSEAVKLYTVAANEGDAQAQDALGDCFAYGKGVECNVDEAILWYRKSAAMGNNLAVCKLENLHKDK